MGNASQKHSLRDKPQRLGEKLRRIRDWHDLSQREMLDYLGYPEYHHAFISMWERGYREPPFIVLLRYARSVNVSTDVLIDDALDLALPANNRSVKRSETKPRVKGTKQKRKPPPQRTK